MLKWFSGKNSAPSVQVLKHAQAMRVIFFYPGEEGTYVDNATVTLFENGVVHIRAQNEETTTHLQHCEILWKFQPIDKNPSGKLRVLNFKNRNGAENDEGPPPL